MKIKKITPAFGNNRNCIVFSTDANFVPLTAVAVQSIIETASPNTVYDIIVLHNDLSLFVQNSFCKLADKNDNVMIRFYNMHNIVKDDTHYTGNRKTLSAEAYFRLYIPWILDEIYESALYIDGDMILLSDIAKVFQTDMGTNLIAAVKDYWGICNCYIPGESRKDYQKKIGLTDFDGYVISATILFNLEEFRKTYQIKDVKECINRYEWLQHDQDVINVLCEGRITYLNPEWGWMSEHKNNHSYLPENLRAEVCGVVTPIIAHFGASRKPYVRICAAYDREFWTYADHTPYFTSLFNKVQSHEYRAYVVHDLLEKETDDAWSESGILRYYRGALVCGVEKGHTRYRVIEVDGDRLHLEGLVGFFGVSLDSDVKVYIKINDELLPVTEQIREDGIVNQEGRPISRNEAFKCDIELDPNQTKNAITVVASLNGMPFEKTNLGFDKFSSLSRKYQNDYLGSEKWIVRTDNAQLHITRADKMSLKKAEKTFCKELWKKKQYNAVIARKLVFIAKRFAKKPIWLISDRVTSAGDNGEAFFKYLREEKKDSVNAYFLLDKGCKDYKYMKQYGHIVSPYSYRHKLLHLLAKYSISSQTDEVYRNPFGKSRECYADLLSKVRFVFLQHGIIVNDLTKWLHDRRQHMFGFITSTPSEHNRILYDGYGIPEKNVWLTGLARFDRLYDKNEKIVTILPTWRKYLSHGQNKKTGVWKLKSNFHESEYATFYRNLMGNERLRTRAKELGYTVQFKLHPSFLKQEAAFGFDKEAVLVDANIPYRDLYASSSLVVTDFSSAVNDFIYLRKPILYCHFDKEEFYSGEHMSSGTTFDYERDGFGEVEYDLEGTVNRIIEYMENDCKLKDKYRERIDNFFMYNDQNNCKRIYDKIIEMDQKN